MIILLYITKVFIASGILFGYYWLFLRNKKFHHYNRFYLLVALIIPIVISFISIPVFSDPDNTVREVFYQTITTISTEPLHQSDSATGINRLWVGMEGIIIRSLSFGLHGAFRYYAEDLVLYHQAAPEISF